MWLLTPGNLLLISMGLIDIFLGPLVWIKCGTEYGDLDEITKFDFK